MPNFAFDGFEIAELVGFGATGQVYRARELLSGEAVALKRLRPEAIAVVERLRRDAAVAAAVDRRHVAVVRDVIATDTDVVLVMPYADGGNLADVLSERGRLDPGEAVTMLAPVAAVLGRLHGAGAVHGNLTPTNILIAADGRPLLADIGLALALEVDLAIIDATADFRDPALFLGGTPTPAGDVFSLGAIGFAVLVGQPPRIGNDRLARFCPTVPQPLLAAIEAAIDRDEPNRPGAEELAEALIAACQAEPLSTPAPSVMSGVIAPDRQASATRTLRVSGPLAPPPRPPVTATSGEVPPVRPRTARLSVGGSTESNRPARSRAAPSRLAVTGIFTFGLVLLGGAGWSRIHHSSAGPPIPAVASEPTTPTVATTAASPSPRAATTTATTIAGWRGIVSYLDATRAQAFATARPSLLRNVYLATAPALAVDQASVRSLASRGLRAAGFTATVQGVAVESASATTATLRVIDRLTPYRLVDRSGATVSTGVGRTARAYTMTLVRTSVGWRVSAILP